MQTLKISPGNLPAEVTIPTSKSYANRALILSALKPEIVTLKNMPQASDVVKLIDAFKKIGLAIAVRGYEVIVKNAFPDCETNGAEIETGEGGTTARFLATLLLLGKERYSLILGDRLKERPWEEFIHVVKSLGGFVELQGSRLVIQGPINNKEKIAIDCSRTTQFATAFDLVFKNSEIEPLNLHSSKSYLAMNAPLKEHFHLSEQYDIPCDWSSAAYPMVFAALNHPIHFPGLSYDPFQADARLLEILNDLGAVENSTDGLIVKKMTRPMPIKISMSECLDLFPALVFLVSHIEGIHELTDLANLSHKESDRLHEMTKILKVFHRDYEVIGDGLRIHGRTQKEGSSSLDLPDDHRIVMTAALFLRHHSGGTLNRSEAVAKSYPNFFDLMR